MLTDYKIISTLESKGLLTIKIRIYKGDITTEDEYDITKKSLVPVTRYRRTKVIGEKTYTIETGERGSKDALEKYSVKMRRDLKTDKTRTPISEQNA